VTFVAIIVYYAKWQHTKYFLKIQLSQA